MAKNKIIQELRKLKDSGILKQAIKLADRALKKEVENQEKIWQLKGFCHLLRGEERLFLIALRKALKLARENKNKKVLSDLYSSLGNFYHQKRKFFQAKQSYQISLGLAKEAGYKHRQGTVIVNLATLYGNLKKYSQAEKLFSFLLKNFKKDKKVYINTLWELAKIERIRGNLERALDLVKQGIQLEKTINLVNTRGDLYKELGRIYKEYSRYNYQKALEIFHQYQYQDKEEKLKKEMIN